MPRDVIEETSEFNREIWAGIVERFAGPRPTLADRQATRADAKRRRLSRYAHCLIQECDARELSGKGLHEDERMALVTALTAIRRMLG